MRIVFILLTLFYLGSQNVQAQSAPEVLFWYELWDKNGKIGEFVQPPDVEFSNRGGMITFDASSSGAGIHIGPNDSTENRELVYYKVQVYLKGNPSGGIPWIMNRAWTGQVTAGKGWIDGNQGAAGFPNGAGNWAVASALYSSPASTYVHNTPCGTPHCPGHQILSLPINYSARNTGTSSTVAKYFTEYPGVKYYRIQSNLTEIKGEGKRRRTFSYQSHPYGSDDPWTRVEAFYTFSINQGGTPKREPSGGYCSGPSEPVTCGEGPCSGSICLSTGNLIWSCEDPVPTRGYPLKNNIHINSQLNSPVRPMGNAVFTYDMHVTQAMVYNSSGVGTNTWIVVAGDGRRLNYGPVSSAPTPEPGVYGTLITHINGYTLSGAGEPEHLAKAGNFTYEFDTSGRLSSITDPSGNEQLLTYNGSNQLIQVEDINSQKIIEFTWTANNITSVSENGSGAVTTLTYSNGRLVNMSVGNAASGTAFEMSYTYTSGGVLASVTRNNNVNTTLNFNYISVPARQSGHNVPLGNIQYPDNKGGTTIIWDAGRYGNDGVETVIQRKDGAVVRHQFNAAGDVENIIYPQMEGGTSSVVYTMAYDTARNMIAFSNGATTVEMEYTSNGLLEKITNDLGNYREFTYSGVNLTSISDNIGVIQEVSYNDIDLPNNPTSIEDAEGNTWTFEYNDYGQLLEIVPPAGSPLGNRIFSYDEDSMSSSLGWLKEIIDGEGNKKTFDAYSALGDILEYSSYVDPSDVLTKQTVKKTYDAAHRTLSFEHPDGKTVATSYSGDRLSYQDDEAGKRTNYSFCARCGSLSQVSKSLNWALSWTRNTNRDLTGFTDARGKETKYEYGKAGELKSTTYPDSSVEESRYDNAGRLSKSINARGQEQVYSYNSAGRIEEISFPTTSDPSISYEYRSDGFIEEVTDGIGVTSYEYWNDRQLKAVEYAYTDLTNVQRIEYTYNEDNSLASITWKDGGSIVGTWTYDYDLAGRMIGAAAFSETTTYTYDGQDKLLTQANANGTELTYTYNDAREWPTNILWKYSGTPFAEYDLEYDGGNNTVGNLTEVTELSGGVVTYDYDDLYRLISEDRTGSEAFTNTFTYDLAGNVTQINGTAFASYDDANKISTLTGGSVSHDGDGNITAFSGTGFPTGTFTWDTRSKITSQTDGVTSITYGYNASGKRVWSKIGSDPKKFYIFSGSTLLGEIEDGVPTVAYTWGAGGLISRRNLSNSSTRWYHFGPQGETRQLTNSSGAVTSTYGYNAYGKMLSSTGSDANPFRYGGRYGYYTEGTSSLMLAGARWYSPDLMRWGSRDPIRYEGDDNLYDYVNQNPIIFFDETGLEPKNPFLDNPNRKPPGYSSDWTTGEDGRGGYSEDPGTGIKYWPQEEDKGHWDHYDYYDESGKKRRYPKNCKKPWPNQKAPPYGDQSETDPWGVPKDTKDDVPLPPALGGSGGVLGPPLILVPILPPRECWSGNCS